MREVGQEWDRQNRAWLNSLVSPDPLAPFQVPLVDLDQATAAIDAAALVDIAREALKEEE